MRRTAVLLSLAITGCGPQTYGDPSECGVAEAELRQAVEEVSEMTPYSGKPLGQCDLIVDDGHNVLIITPEIKRSVERMMAREEAEAKD